MDIELQTTKKFNDLRGDLVEFLTIEDIKKNGNQFGHVFIATFDNQYGIRGNHYHEKQHEYYMVASGSIKVVLEDIKTKKRKTVILSAKGKVMKKLRIGPYIAHACYSMTPTAVLVSYYKFPYNPKKRDTIPYDVVKKI